MDHFPSSSLDMINFLSCTKRPSKRRLSASGLSGPLGTCAFTNHVTWLNCFCHPPKCCRWELMTATMYKRVTSFFAKSSFIRSAAHAKKKKKKKKFTFWTTSIDSPVAMAKIKKKAQGGGSWWTSQTSTAVAPDLDQATDSMSFPLRKSCTLQFCRFKRTHNRYAQLQSYNPDLGFSLATFLFSFLLFNLFQDHSYFVGCPVQWLGYMGHTCWSHNLSSTITTM